MILIQIKKLDLKIDNIPYSILLQADPSKKMIDNYLQKGECFAAYYNQKIIAILVLVHIHKDAIEIKNIAVETKYRKQGIGKQLLLFAEEYAKENNIHSIYIGTGNSSLQQLKFYQKFGYRIISIDLDYFIKNYDDEIYENGIKCRDMLILQKDL